MTHGIESHQRGVGRLTQRKVLQGERAQTRHAYLINSFESRDRYPSKCNPVNLRPKVARLLGPCA